jgi:hypothetical protein
MGAWIYISAQFIILGFLIVDGLRGSGFIVLGIDKGISCEV